MAVIGAAVLALGILMAAAGAWRLVDGIRNVPAEALPGRADAIVVFAGESDRFILGAELAQEGRAPVLVLSAARLPPQAEGWCEEPPAAVEVVCVVPRVDSTFGEAVAFADLARERGWGNVIGVTGNYHAQRAGMLLTRCFEGESRFALVDWPTPRWELTLDEARKTIGDWLWSRGC